MKKPIAFNRFALQLPAIRIPPPLMKALLASQVFAISWWISAYYLSIKTKVPAWYDQQAAFLVLPEHWLTPYTVLRFANPPWTVLPFFLFRFFSFYGATLIETCLYFALLTLVIFKFGGGLKTALLVFSSFVALDATIELNIDWLICVGLLVPQILSGPFLLIKPQDALGYWLSFSRKTIIRAAIVVLLVFLISLLIWGFWPPQMLDAMRRLGAYGQYQFNLAPASFLSYPVSLVFGLLLVWYSFRRRDPVIAILAGLFFVPYIAFYSLLLHFALFSIRFPRFALLISALLWVIYGRIFVIGLTQ